jgi:CRISPR-associated protein Csa3
MTETKTYLSTMGFHESFVLRLLSRTNATRDDELIIVVPKPVIGGVAEAIDSLKASCSRMRYPEPRVEEIELGDFPSTLSQILDVVLSSKGIIHANLSVGLRSMDVLILLAILLSRKPFFAYLMSESGEGHEIVVKGDEVYSLLKEYTVEDLKLLYAISRKGEVTLSELANELGKSEKTVVNRLNELKKAGLVVIKGKDRGVSLTQLGNILLKMRSLERVKSVNALENSGKLDW